LRNRSIDHSTFAKSGHFAPQASFAGLLPRTIGSG
jgi:hypothetical protein